MVSLKGGQIVITSERDVDRLISNSSQLIMQQDRFVISTVTRLIETEIVDTIHQKMRGKNISKKVIDTTFLSTKVNNQNGTIIFEIVSNYVSDTGFAVAVMIERGRKSYIIFPKPATDERKNPHLSYLIKGVRIFSKKSKIPKKPASNIIKDTVLQKTPKVQQKLNRAYKTWINSVLRSKGGI